MTISGPRGASSERPALGPLRASISAIPRRVNHGGAAWLRRRGQDLRQPQDGAPGQQNSSAERVALQLNTVERRTAEAEDARMTGGTRCLMRRLMGLNITQSKADPARDGFMRRTVTRQTLTA